MAGSLFINASLLGLSRDGVWCQWVTGTLAEMVFFFFFSGCDFLFLTFFFVSLSHTGPLESGHRRCYQHLINRSCVLAPVGYLSLWDELLVPGIYMATFLLMPMLLGRGCRMVNNALWSWLGGSTGTMRQNVDILWDYFGGAWEDTWTSVGFLYA